MATAKAVSGNIQRKRGGITVFTGGTLSSSGNTQVTEMVSHANSAYRQGSQNGLPVLSATKGNVKAVSAGSYHYFLKGHWVVLANSITTQLGGISNTILRSGAAHVFRRQFARKTTYRTHFTSGVQWGSPTISGPQYTITKSNSTISFSDDASRTFDATEPGEYTYMVTGKLPTNVGYQAVKLW